MPTVRPPSHLQENSPRINGSYCGLMGKEKNSQENQEINFLAWALMALYSLPSFSKVQL